MADLGAFLRKHGKYLPILRAIVWVSLVTNYHCVLHLHVLIVGGKSHMNKTTNHSKGYDVYVI